MNSETILNSNYNLDVKNTIPRDSLNPNSSNNNTISIENNNNINNFSNTNSIMNNNFNLLQKQNKNLQNQILVLTLRIKEYEKDYIMNNDKKAIQIKEFSQKENELMNQIQYKNEIINSLNEENKKLKIHISQTEQDLNLLKIEVKNLLEIKKRKEAEKELEKNIIENQSQDLINMLKKYSDEIFYLKQQNRKLVSNMNMMSKYNEDKNKIISNEENIKVITEQSKFENYLNDFINKINEELFIISQWIEIYLGKEYDKGFEIPSLINDIDNKVCINKIDSINFNLIKSALEKSTINLNSLLNSKENEIIKLKNIIKDKENKYNELKKELIKFKDKQIELSNENDTLKMEKENEAKMILNHKTLINDLKKNDENYRDYNFNYLKEIYEIIQNEINLILSDDNFKVFHQKIFNLKENINIYQNNVNFLEDKLNNLLIKFIEFVEELRYDYIQTKKENFNILLSKANKKKDLLIQNNQDDLINTYKRKISELTNNNNFLNEQMKILNKNNELNLLNDDLSRYSNILEANKELKFNNDNLMNKIKEMNNNYLNLSKQNNQLKQTIKELKIIENNDMDLKSKLNDLSNDYQRILKENDSLKIYINSQN